MTTTPKDVKLSQEDIVRAATNAPTLAKDQFTLGTRTFSVVDLSYDDYMTFMVLLGPMMESVIGGVMTMQGVSVTSSQLSPKDIITHLSGSLPELARLVCAQTDPTVTIEFVKKEGKTPFKLAEIVLKQIEQNRIISDIASFFAQMLPVIKTALNLNR